MSATWQCAATTAQDTEAAGAELASILRGGDLVELRGDLGAGKTTFARGLARGLGVASSVRSPTFPIVVPYPTTAPGISELLHVDCYRLEDPAELVGTGLLDQLGAEVVVVVEWLDLAGGLLGAPDLVVTLTGDDDGVRQMTLRVEDPARARTGAASLGQWR